jgi:hypothetical protein
MPISRPAAAATPSVFQGLAWTYSSVMSAYCFAPSVIALCAFESVARAL